MLRSAAESLPSVFRSSAGEPLALRVEESDKLSFARLASWVRDAHEIPSALDNLQLAFANGASPNARTSETGQNLLAYACRRGAWPAAIFLLESGASPAPLSSADASMPPRPLLDRQFSENNHPLIASAAFLSEAQSAQIAAWTKSKAPASESARVCDSGFEAFLERWIEAGGALTPEMASTRALAATFKTPVFSMAHAFFQHEIDASRWEPLGIFPLRLLAFSRLLRPLGAATSDRFLAGLPALRQCAVDLGLKLIDRGADCDGLLFAEKGSDAPAPLTLGELFSAADPVRIPGFDAHLRERLFAAIEARDLLADMRRSFYGDSLPLGLLSESSAAPSHKGAARL